MIYVRFAWEQRVSSMRFFAMRHFLSSAQQRFHTFQTVNCAEHKDVFLHLCMYNNARIPDALYVF